MPVAAVARQARGLDTQHRTHFPAAHFRHESLKPGALTQAGSRAPQVLVDHINRSKAQLARVLRQLVLPVATLAVVRQLSDR